MENKCDGNANVKVAWFGASKDEIRKIISHGFGYCGKSEPAKSNELFGCGIYLHPKDFSLKSVKSSTVDEDGLRHVLLCRTILGKTEVIHPGSEQCHPSSEEFDSGVDNLSAPKKYIVWSTHMNTHILPEYVVSYKAPSCLTNLEGCPIGALLYGLQKLLPPHTMSLIFKYCNDHLEKKISLHELVQQMVNLAGKKLLLDLAKSYIAWRTIGMTYSGDIHASIRQWCVKLDLCCLMNLKHRLEDSVRKEMEGWSVI
ncbi:probable inactive poly [ADP-ribose] polymerase SRO5 [Cornus florida]|uniref:probable inactive poly [ADP-ribose] polymerase SRO5 n=1 Tax=Cornus florida TaxID=4283 RepID=UPI00289E97EF|nr:probable inactive poly [ADP-ribose] polymerase SRO5 [Cornus florida]